MKHYPTPTEQDASLLAKRRDENDVQNILTNLFKSCLSRSIGTRSFFAPSLPDIRKSLEGILKSADGDWKKIMDELEKLLAAHGVTNAKEAARRACAIAEKS